MRLCLLFIYLNICSKTLTSGVLDNESDSEATSVCGLLHTHTHMHCRAGVLTMFAECFLAPRFSCSSLLHKNKSTVAARESKWN